MNKDKLYEKETRILSYFVGWLIIGFCILFIGVNNVFASTYYSDDYMAQLYDNTNGNLTAVTTNREDSWSPGYYYGWIQLVANSSGGAWGISSPIPLIANHTYSMTVNTINIGCGYTILSSVNRIGVGTTLNNAKSSYQNNTNVTEKFSQAVNSSRYLQFVFTPTTNSSYIVFPFASTSSCSSAEIHLDNIIIEDLGESGVSQNDINNSLNNQTNELNNSIQNSTDTITGEIDDMEQNIIDSNKETQDVIKDQFETCRPSYNLFDVPSVWSFNRNTNTPTNIPAGTYYITTGEVIKGGTEAPVIIFNNQIVELTSNMNQVITFDTDITSYKYYSNGYSWVNSEGITSTVKNLMISKNGGKYEPYGEEICSNRIDETNDKLDDLNGSLNNSNIDGSLGNAGGFFNNFSTSDHGGLSGIITAPLVAINQMLNKSCNPMTTNFKGKEISLPCGYQFWSKMGAIQEFLNLVLGGLLCYQIIIKLFNLIEKIKNPEDDRVEVMKL